MIEDSITITSHGGRTFDSLLFKPDSGRGPGMVVLHEIFGVNDYIRQVARLYAAEGFVVAAPSVYWRQRSKVDLQPTEEGLKEALALHNELDVDAAARDVAAVAAALRKRPEVTGKVGAVGFCLGGRLAYLAAVRSKLDAAVSYYGPYIERYLDDAPNLSCPLMLHCAAKDPYIPMSAVDSIRSALGGRKDVYIYMYPDVDHGFNRLGGPEYDWQSAMLAHSRTMYHFRQALGPAGI